MTTGHVATAMTRSAVVPSTSVLRCGPVGAYDDHVGPDLVGELGDFLRCVTLADVDPHALPGKAAELRGLFAHVEPQEPRDAGRFGVVVQSGDVQDVHLAVGDPHRDVRRLVQRESAGVGVAEIHGYDEDERAVRPPIFIGHDGVSLSWLQGLVPSGA